MLIDLDHCRPERFAADVCIVGTGAAGLSLASELAGSGASVMLLESGGAEVEDAAQRLNRCETDALLFEGAHLGRTRAFGGSTNCWGGQLLPLDPIDFERRAWVDHSGWPIGPEDLAPYYRRALAFAGSDERNFDTDVLAALGTESPFEPEVVRFFYSKWTPNPRLRDLVSDRLGATDGPRVFLHANVTRLDLDESGGRVREIRVANQSGAEFTFAGETVVLCTGGIETPRMLLANRLGIADDLVGRYFQDHPSLLVGTLRSRDPQRTFSRFASSKVDGREVTPRLSLSAEAQERRGFVNASAYLSFAYPRMLLRRAMLLNLLRASARSPGGARDLLDAGRLLAGPTLRMRRQAARLAAGEQFAVTVVSEQEPSADSRITLGRRRDRFGVPQARIDWRVSERTWRSIVGVSEVLREQFARAGVGELELFPHVTGGRPYWRVFPHDLYHHMGATRMGASPQTGVVDEDCRVYGVENLYVASGSVFPTGGHSNCTLTIMALAMRLGDHLTG